MFESIIAPLTFFLAFCGMVIIHEFGHFIVARLCKIEVEEFGIGLPTPGAITLFRWQGTRFTLNWLPLGGFVRPKGESDPNIPGGLAAANPWKRFAVLIAGPLMNLLSAVVIFNIIFFRTGFPDTGRVLVTAVVSESPAAQAGFQSGDIFVSGGGEPITNYAELRGIVDSNENKPVLFLIERAGDQIELTVTPRILEAEGPVMIGVGLSHPLTRPGSWFESIPLSVEYTWVYIKEIAALPARLITDDLTPEEGRIIGPVGMYRIFEQTVSRDIESVQTPSSDPLDGPFRTLSLIAAISISLGIFNLLPFPALDGGRILFLLPELIFRRRIPHERENFVHGVAMMLLLGFMVYIILNDIINPINITIP